MGKWKYAHELFHSMDSSPLIPVDELGNGVVDIYGASTTGTNITANVYDYGMTPIDDSLEENYHLVYPVLI